MIFSFYTIFYRLIKPLGVAMSRTLKLSIIAHFILHSNLNLDPKHNKRTLLSQEKVLKLLLKDKVVTH